MRDTRLLSLAVLAVALGFAAPALGDIAVATLIIDPDGAVGEWESKIRLWSELGPNTEASGLGFLDFVLVEVSGTVAGGKEVNDSANVSPTGTMQPVGGGVQIPTGLHKVRRDGWETGAEGVGLMAAQWWYRQDANNLVDNYAFARADANAVLDQAVLPGIGVSDNPGWTPPDAAYENVGAAPNWEADTKVATGTYLDGNTFGTLRLQTEGNLSFSVLEPSPPRRQLPRPERVPEAAGLRHRHAGHGRRHGQRGRPVLRPRDGHDRRGRHPAAAREHRPCLRVAH